MDTKALPPQCGIGSTRSTLCWRGGAWDQHTCTWGYADDTEVVAPGEEALQRTAHVTERWHYLTGQEVNVEKSIVWVLGIGGGVVAARIRLLDAPIPAAEEFRRLGVGIQVRPVRGIGPLLGSHMERGVSVLTRMPQLTMLRRHSTVVGSMAMAVALHEVELAEVADLELACLETQTLRAICGPNRPRRAALSRAMHAIFLMVGRNMYCPHPSGTPSLRWPSWPYLQQFATPYRASMPRLCGR